MLPAPDCRRPRRIGGGVSLKDGSSLVVPSLCGRGNGLHPHQRWVHQRRIGRAIPGRSVSSRLRRRGPGSVAGPRPRTGPVTSAVAGTCAGDPAPPGSGKCPTKWFSRPFDEARLLVTAQNLLPKRPNAPFYVLVHCTISSCQRGGSFWQLLLWCKLCHTKRSTSHHAVAIYVQTSDRFKGHEEHADVTAEMLLSRTSSA